MEGSSRRPEAFSGSNGANHDQGCKARLKKLLSLLINVLRCILFFLDIVLDITVAVKFYKEEAYVSLGILVCVLIGSAVVTNIYSWLWYKYDEFDMMTNLDRIFRSRIWVLHVLLAGVSFRIGALLAASTENMKYKSRQLKSIITYRKHDLRILKIFDSFLESAPQIVLMLTIALQGEGWILNVYTALKTLLSLLSITFAEAKYYHSIISFLPEDAEPGLVREICGYHCWNARRLVLYFFWKLILLSCRLVALALFASVEPCFIFAHFLCSWLVLFFCTAYMETSFMGCDGGRWLFRGTLGLIWYFSWFSGVEAEDPRGDWVKGKTFRRMLCYHVYKLVDVSFLCGMWYWKMSSDPPHYEISCLNVAITAVSVPAFYLAGVVLKGYYFFEIHPSKRRNGQNGENTEQQETGSLDQTDGGEEPWMRVRQQEQSCAQTFKNLLFYVFYAFYCLIKLPCLDCRENLGLEKSDNSQYESSKRNERMKKLAHSFYC